MSNIKKEFQSTQGSSDSPRATYQDVLDTPPNLIAEIIDGKLYTQPRPGRPHGKAQFRLANLIGTPFDLGNGGPGGWEFQIEPELHLSEDILVPDLAGWRLERMSESLTTAFFTIVPDWVCEIHSDRTRNLGRGHKQQIYAREGVAFLWFIDPKARSLEAFMLHGTKWMLIDHLFNNAIVSLPPFEEISFSLGDLWPAPPYTIHKESPNYPTSETTQEIK